LQILQTGIKVVFEYPLSLSGHILLFIFELEAPAEALHATGSVKDTLLASKEWVTFRTHVNLHYGFDAERLKAVSTSAAYCGFDIGWMYAFFHGYSEIDIYQRPCT